MRALLVTLVALSGLLALPAAAAAPSVPEVAQPEVIGGQPADPGEDPWMAALVLKARYEPNPFAGLVCGASFISPDTLVTAAHCVQAVPAFALQIAAGSNNLVRTEIERIGIRNIRVHPKNDPRNGLYDLAVIQLVRAPRTFTPTPIDLVAPGDAALWEPGDLARFTGWGVDGIGQPISQLQEADDPIVSDADCLARYGRRFFRGRTMLCVGEVGQGGGTSSPCFGDSGGPLTVLDGSRPVLIGLVLGGLRCGDPNYPAIFTQVSAAVPFLERYLDPDTVPWPVRNLRANRRGPEGRAILVTWRAPAFDGGAAITRYRVKASWNAPGIVTGVELTVGGDARSARIRQIPDDVRVRVTVTPINAVGRGRATTVEVPA